MNKIQCEIHDLNPPTYTTGFLVTSSVDPTAVEMGVGEMERFSFSVAGGGMLVSTPPDSTSGTSSEP